MWVVYHPEDYDGDWGHKYFNMYENAKAYYDLEKKGICRNVEIEEIETED